MQWEMALRDIPAEEIVELFMGVYLMTQFAWNDISGYSDEHCTKRVNQAIDRLLTGLAP